MGYWFDMETKRMPNWSSKEILLLHEVHQGEFSATLTVPTMK